jgi:hypothetical protein
LYLQEGDANTSFFHQQARYRKKKNFIAKFQVEEHIVTSQEEKQQAALDFYDNLLGTAEHRDYTLDLHSLGIQQHDLGDLELVFFYGGGLVSCKRSTFGQGSWARWFHRSFL